MLVGRDDFLTLAERRLAETATGAGQLLFVAGEAGIGKTRLLGAIARPAHASNFTAQVPVVSNMLAYIAEQASLGQHPGLLVRLVALAFIDVRSLRQHFISDLEALELQQSVPVNLVPANPEVILSGGSLPAVGPVIRQVLIEHGQERPSD
jgi:ABC-type lipoprotein export system ATPase subunit